MWQKHNIINTPDLLQKLDDFVTKQKPTLIAVDTETNGLSFTRNVVVGVSLSVDSEMGFYIPLLDWFPNTEITKSSKKTGLTYPEGCFKDVWKEAYYEEGVKPGWYKPPGFIKAYLKKWLLDSNAEIIMHNAPFDVLMIEGTFGLDLTDKVWCDTALLKHVIDENTPHGLKETAVRWADKIGFDTEADKEQQEMGVSVIKNGGKFLKRDKWIWRASPDVMAKYAAQDTILTYALYEEGLRRLTTEYEEKHLDWFFRDEVMPLCREVVIPMKRQGAYIDVPYFKEMEQEVENKLEALEESMFAEISDYLSDFPLGSPVNDIVSLKKLVLEIVKRDRLEMPLAKGKVTFAKAAIKAQFEKTGHWVWGWYLGENDPILSPTELEKLKTDIYYQEMGHRYVFNFKSDKHIRWLLFSKLGLSTGDFPVTEGGDVSVNAKALKTINKKFPFIRKILLYKKLSKQLGTYIKPALKLQDDGWLRMDFKQNGTTSGRFACSGGYNLQTLPKVEELDRCPQCEAKAPTVTQTMKILADLHCPKCGYTEEDIFTPSAIKKGFIAPPGWKIINADFSSLEPRCFAENSADPKLKAVYLQNLDLYSKVYCDMEDREGQYSPDPKESNFLKKLAPEKRTMVKPVVLGIPYGARDWQTAVLMNFKKKVFKNGVEVEVVDVERGAEFRRLYLDTYPELQKYMLKQELNAIEHGFTETVIGRRRHFRWTKEVGKLLAKAGIPYEDFVDCPKRELRTFHLNDVMNHNALKKLILKNGMSLFDVKKKQTRQWDFVHALFVNELNNAKNFPIQGMAAHIANRSMLELARYYKKQNINAVIILQVHDEITALAKEEEVEIASKYHRLAMEKNEYTKLISIPMEADPIVCDNLKDSK